MTRSLLTGRTRSRETARRWTFPDRGGVSSAPNAFAGPTVNHRLTDSTHDRARELAIGGSPSGTVVTADEQSAGRGRTGRTWSAPAGSALLCSAILRPLE